MQPSGHGFIKTTMLERQAELGVEVSGHHFFGALGGGDDGLFTALVVLTLLRQLNSSLHSQLRADWLAQHHARPASPSRGRLPFDLGADCRQLRRPGEPYGRRACGVRRWLGTGACLDYRTGDDLPLRGARSGTPAASCRTVPHRVYPHCSTR